MDEEQKVQTPRKGRKRILIILLLLVAAVGGTIYLLLPPPEPSYKGKPLAFWLRQFQELPSSDAEDPKIIECREAIRTIGAAGIPTLLRMLRAKDSMLRLKIMEWLDDHDVSRNHFVPAEEQNVLAVTGFQCLGDLATNAIPALIDIYNHASTPPSKEGARSALMAMYPAPGVAVPYWEPPEKRAEWYFAAGTMKFNIGEYSNANLAYSESVKLNPTNAEAILSRAMVRTELHDWTGALADAQKTLELEPKEETALYLQGVCEFSMKDFKAAEADLTTAIKLNAKNGAAYNYRGLARGNLRRVDDALADFNQAIALCPFDAAAYRNRAMVETLHREYETAMADVSKAIDLDGKDPYTYAARGRIKNSLKDYKGAREDFDRAIELNGKDSNTYVSRAAANVYLDEFENANADLETAAKLGPESASAHVVRGFLEAKRGDDEAALAEFEEGVALAPQMAETYMMLGLFQYRASRLAPALETCRKAMELHPLADTADLRAYIWLIRAQTGEEKEANAELETFLKTLQGAKTNEWEASIARFFSGGLAESNFLSQATTTAKRPSAVKGQVCESYYYVGMKRKLAGDKLGAVEMFQKSIDTKNDNNLGYLNAVVEMRKLKQTH
jgi:tetratricopeptide (TPR) repeat protein